MISLSVASSSSSSLTITSAFDVGSIITFSIIAKAFSLTSSLSRDSSELRMVLVSCSLMAIISSSSVFARSSAVSIVSSSAVEASRLTITSLVALMVSSISSICISNSGSDILAISFRTCASSRFDLILPGTAANPAAAVPPVDILNPSNKPEAVA